MVLLFVTTIVRLKNSNIIYILKMINETRFDASLFLYFHLIPKKEQRAQFFSGSLYLQHLHCTIAICWA